MLVASKLSYALGHISLSDWSRVEKLINKLGYNLQQVSAFSFKSIFEIMQHDKKVKNNKIHLVLLNKLGEAFITSDCELGLIESIFSEVKKQP